MSQDSCCASGFSPRVHMAAWWRISFLHEETKFDSCQNPNLSGYV
jgi:hypothetical protein